MSEKPTTRFAPSRRRRRHEARQQPCGAVAAAGAEHRLELRVRQRRQQLGEAPLVITGQIPMFAEDPRSVLRPVARGEHRESGIERAALEATRRRNDGHRIVRMDGFTGLERDGGQSFRPRCLKIQAGAIIARLGRSERAFAPTRAKIA